MTKDGESEEERPRPRKVFKVDPPEKLDWDHLPESFTPDLVGRLSTVDLDKLDDPATDLTDVQRTTYEDSKRQADAEAVAKIGAILGKFRESWSPRLSVSDSTAARLGESIRAQQDAVAAIRQPVYMPDLGDIVSNADIVEAVESLSATFEARHVAEMNLAATTAESTALLAQLAVEQVQATRQTRLLTLAVTAAVVIDLCATVGNPQTFGERIIVAIAGLAAFGALWGASWLSSLRK